MLTKMGLNVLLNVKSIVKEEEMKEPYRDEGCWDYDPHNDVCIELPKGTIKKILGRELTWEDEPVELR